MAASRRYTFQAALQEGRGGGAYVLFPYDVEKEFGTKGRVAVKALLNGVPYTGSLVKYGTPRHMLGVLKSIREQTGVAIGGNIDVEIWRDETERTVEAPPAFLEKLEHHGLLAAFERLSYSHRKEYCRWLTEAKKEETRAMRLEKAVEMVKRGIRTPDAPKQGSAR